MASQDWFEKDFYAILGVPQDADDAAIKKAYRKLARKHHPDQNAGDAAAEQRFKDVGEANSVLSDPEKRREYDAVRADGARRRPLHRRRSRRRRAAASTTCSPRCSVAAEARRRRPRAVLDRRRRRRAQPRGPARRDVRRRRCRPGIRRGPVSARRQGPRKGADLTARTSLSLPRRGRGRHGHPRHQRRRPDHHADPRRGQGRPEDPAARQGPARRRRGAGRRPHPHRHGGEAPGVRP